MGLDVSVKDANTVVSMVNTNEKIPFYVHGSEDSMDIDTLYLFPEIPSHKECINFCSGSKVKNQRIILK